jgi:O-antigen/teichoic acid export membrane protein
MRHSPYERAVSAGKLLLAGKTTSAAAVQSLITKFLVYTINALTGVVVARALHPAGRGEMAAMIMWSGFLSTLLTFGLPTSLVYNLRRAPARGSGIVSSAITLACGVVMLVGMVGFFLVPLWLHKYSPADIVCARWFLLSSPLPMFLLVGRASMEADGRFSQSNASLFAAPAITLLCLGSFRFLHRLTPVTGGLSYVLGNAPVVCWLTYCVFRRYHPQAASAVAYSGELLHYGVRSWGIDLLNALALQSDQVLVLHFLNAAAMGTYVVAANFARILSMFQTAAVTVLFPRVAARAPGEVVRITGRALRISVSVTLGVAFLMGLAGPVLLSAIYGREYSQHGVTIFRTVLLDVIFSGATLVMAQAFMALGRPGVVTVVQAIGVGTGLALMTVLIPRFGPEGAAAALATSSFIRFCLTMICFRPLLKIAPPRLFLTRDDAAFLRERMIGFVHVPAVAN